MIKKNNFPDSGIIADNGVSGRKTVRASRMHSLMLNTSCLMAIILMPCLITWVYIQQCPDNAAIAYRIGLCYLNIEGKKNMAVEYLEKASLKVTAKYREGILKTNGSSL